MKGQLVLATCAALLNPPMAWGQSFQRPIELSRAEEIDLALSAAPQSVAKDARVLVLGATGYEEARSGSNEFTCLVEHEDVAAVEPVCYDRVGRESLLIVAMFLAQQRLAGRAETEIQEEIAARYNDGRFVAPRKAGVAYMLSPRASIPPHVMFYAPYATETSTGLALAGAAPKHAPMLYGAGKPNAYIIVMMPGGVTW